MVCMIAWRAPYDCLLNVLRASHGASAIAQIWCGQVLLLLLLLLPPPPPLLLLLLLLLENAKPLRL